MATTRRRESAQGDEDLDHLDFSRLRIDENVAEEELPEFPLSPKPHCRRCGRQPDNQRIVRSGNRNGNAGRPYYKCDDCANNTGQGVRGRLQGWITWDDNRGVDISNPKCYCEIVSRQDRAGAHRSISNKGFWTCATGRCSYYSTAKNGQTVEQREEDPDMAGYLQFDPWLL